MIKPDLFDVIELLITLPDHDLKVGEQGTIVELYPDGSYEVEFSNDQGETLALCPLSPEQFMVVWQAKTKAWVSLADRLMALINHLPNERQQEVLDFAFSLCQN